jgi:curved DNA-binding protein CbpA
MIDYYEFLQISPHADAETIHRVYRYLAARFHPDNPNTGDPDMFRLLKAAYDVLSNPASRSEYDVACSREAKPQDPLSTSIDFMDSVDGELNRRVAVLTVLYFQRRSNPRFPEVPLAEVEKRMGFPRDYLDFTTWYLQKKGYISRADNSDFTLTADGVDYIESQRAHVPILNRLLTDGRLDGNGSVASSRSARSRRESIVLPAGGAPWKDRRSSKPDRRTGRFDPGFNGIERRSEQGDRRVNGVDRRKNGDRRTYLPTKP